MVLFLSVASLMLKSKKKILSGGYVLLTPISTTIWCLVYVVVTQLLILHRLICHSLGLSTKWMVKSWWWCHQVVQSPPICSVFKDGSIGILFVILGHSYQHISLHKCSTMYIRSYQCKKTIRQVCIGL